MDTTPTRIRNRATGEEREHDAGPVPDGWGPAGTSFLLMDHGAGGGGPSAATLGSAARILGQHYAEADYRGMGDQAARHAIVRKRLGAAAEGKAPPFLDAAWATLAGTGSTPFPRLPDAHRAVAAEGVRRALADHAGRDRQVGRDAAAGAHDARTRVLADAWKTDAHQAEDAAYAAALAEQGDDPRAAYRARAAMMANAWRSPV